MIETRQGVYAPELIFSSKWFVLDKGRMQPSWFTHPCRILPATD